MSDEIKYTEVTICLPEFFEDGFPFREDEGSMGAPNQTFAEIRGSDARKHVDIVNFTKGQFAYEAKINQPDAYRAIVDATAFMCGSTRRPHSDSVKLDKLASTLRTYVVNPVREQVEADMQGVEGLLEELREICKETGLQTNLFYRKTEEGFRVYSGGDREGIVFDRVLKKRDKGELECDVGEAAQYLEQEDGHTPFVSGETLQEALYRAVVLYREGKELEMKYLLQKDGVDHATDALDELYDSMDDLVDDVRSNGKHIRQGYFPIIATGVELVQRWSDETVDFIPKEARLRDKGGNYFLTLKGNGGVARNELEIGISQEQFDQFWDLTEGQRVDKTRLSVPYCDRELEIDVYNDRDLVVAEVEAPTLYDLSKVTAIGKDVTEDRAYKNRNLAK